MNSPEQPSWTTKKGWERGDDAEREVKRQEQAAQGAAVRQEEPLKTKRENPWAKGDEYEAELGTDKVDQLRLRHRERSVLKEAATKLKAGMARMRAETDPEQGKQRLLEAAQDFFRQVIRLNGGSATEKFNLDRETGKIRIDVKEYFAKKDPSRPRFLMCALPVGQEEQDIGVSTPDEIRNAARAFMGQHPDVVFSFDEDRTQGTFSYTAKLIERSE
jgi:hypothetical protein